MEMREIRQARLRELLKDFASLKAFSAQAGLSDRHVSQMKTGNRGMGETTARRIEGNLGLPDYWMDSLPDSEAKASNVEPGPQIQRGVPLISWVQAGDPEIVADPYQPGDADKWFPCPVPCSERTFALKVSGPSMEPEYHDGEIIFVDPDVEPKPNDDVVVRFDDIDHAVFKRLRYDEGGNPYLEAVNDAWRPRYQELNEHAAICGKVIFSGRPR